MNKCLINGTYFDCEGASIYGGGLHLTVSLVNHTLNEFIDAVNAGEEPILILTTNPIDSEEYIILHRYIGFTYLEATSLTYDHMFSDQTTGTMLNATLTETPVRNRVEQSENDITDIQMAIAELAELIVGGE